MPQLAVTTGYASVQWWKSCAKFKKLPDKVNLSSHCSYFLKQDGQWSQALHWYLALYCSFVVCTGISHMRPKIRILPCWKWEPYFAPRFPGVFSVQQLWQCCQVSRQEREASLNVFIKIIYIHSHVVLANTSTTRKMACILLSPPWGLCLMLTPTHRGSATLQVLCSYLSHSPHHCLAMARVGSPFHATINQENLGHRNKKYL